MKRLISIALSLFFILTLASCDNKDTYRIKITVPAGTTKDVVYQEDFIYSDEEISPTGDKITIWCGESLGDTEVVLKPIEVKE